jgi:hypothetical protein
MIKFLLVTLLTFSLFFAACVNPFYSDDFNPPDNIYPFNPGFSAIANFSSLPSVETRKAHTREGAE